MLAVELLCAAQAIDLRKPERLGRGTAAAHAAIREVIPPLTCDRLLADDIESVISLEKRGLISSAVERAVGAIA